MIRRPAMMAGITFERRGDPEEGLDDVLRDAASGNPTVLPLLQFTLRRAMAAQRRLGCVALLRLREPRRSARRAAAARGRGVRRPAGAGPGLVAEGAGRAGPYRSDRRANGILQNRISRDQFSGSPDCLALISAFVDAHLLVSDQAPDGTAVIGLAHEALLREWPPAVRWIEQNRGLLRLRAGITAAAMLWRNNDSAGRAAAHGRAAEGRHAPAQGEPGNPGAGGARLCRIVDRPRAPQAAAHGQAGRGRGGASLRLAILIPTIGSASSPTACRSCERCRRSGTTSQRIPISAAAAGNLQASIDSLGGFLHGVLRGSGRAARIEFMGGRRSSRLRFTNSTLRISLLPVRRSPGSSCARS